MIMPSLRPAPDLGCHGDEQSYGPDVHVLEDTGPEDLRPGRAPNMRPNGTSNTMVSTRQPGPTAVLVFGPNGMLGRYLKSASIG